MQDTVARACTRPKVRKTKRARDDRVYCIQDLTLLDDNEFGPDCVDSSIFHSKY